MYAYIDETGNTGAHLFDNNQPLFITAALLTRSDFDIRFAEDLRSVSKSIGVEELHANELGFGGIEKISQDILRIIRKSGPTFFLARVEKRYILASKVVDTIFDNGENMAVAWHVYNARPLRLMLVFKIASILDDEIAAAFWDALLDANNARAHAKMAEFCRKLNHRVGLVPDKRSQEIIGEGLEWAAKYPEALGFVHQSKVGRKGHLPNMVGFGNLLAGIERQSSIWKRPVDVIKHDRQHEFAASLKFWHEMYSQAPADVIILPLGEKMVLRKVFGSELQMSSAQESAGIQIIDVILWLFSRSLRGDQVPPGCQAILQYVYRRAYQEDFSFAGVGASAEEMIGNIQSTILEPEQLDRARTLQLDFERRRQEQMQAYTTKDA